MLRGICHETDLQVNTLESDDKENLPAQSENSPDKLGF
jgi:hypothetical protein